MHAGQEDLSVCSGVEGRRGPILSPMKENSPPSAAAIPASPTQPWRSPWRYVVSALLLWHLLAVVAPPLQQITLGSTREPSPFANAVLEIVRPYMSALFLDHGYAFFAPEPGPLHLVRYKVEFADGRPAIEGRFPNLREQKPRLLYHRYFMIAEYLEAMYTPPTEPPKPIPPPLETFNYNRIVSAQNTDYNDQLAAWRARRSQYDQMRKSLIAHLEDEHPGGTVTLTRVRHLVLPPPEVTLSRRKLNDADTYVDLPEDEGTQAPQPSPLPIPSEVLP